MEFSVWFSVLVLVVVQNVFCRQCPYHNIETCDECVRCGATYCNTTRPNVLCQEENLSDGFCSVSPRYEHPAMKQTILNGSEMYPTYLEEYTAVKGRASYHIKFQQKDPTQIPRIKSFVLLNSTVQDVIEETHFEHSYVPPSCENGICTVLGAVTPTEHFCPDYGRMVHSLIFQLVVDGLTEAATVKVNVYCSCADTTVCANGGEVSGNSCLCKDGWRGEFCELPNVEINLPSPPVVIEHPGYTHLVPQKCQDRGDIGGLCKEDPIETTCSNNGACHCDNDCKCHCKCNQRNPLSYYNEYCTDICTSVSFCDDCLNVTTPGKCDQCNFNLIVDALLNNTFMEYPGIKEKWTRCNLTLNGCFMEYAAMRDGFGIAHVVVMDPCKVAGTEKIAAVNVTVPAVLGVLVVVAMAAAAAGYMLWKNRTPPLPLTDPQYQNIDAEDCTGENPLYKPPTSSFKNPTYGKW